MFLVLSTLISLFIFVLYIHFKRKYRFWKDLKVPFIEPTFPTGNVSDFLKTNIHFSYVIEKLYKKLKKHCNEDFGGIYFFGNPVFLVLTPEFAKTVLVRDFHYFMDRGIYFNGEVDVLSANIFFLRGAKWKKLREKLSPTFSSGKLKQMFFTVLEVGQRLDQHLQPFAARKDDIDVRDILGRFMTDVIASCAFGLETDCINNPNSRFREMGKKMINFPKSKALKLILASTFQKQATMLGVRWNDPDVSEFFINVVRETIQYRKESGLRRNDFMQLLIDMMKDENVEIESEKNNESLTFEEIAAQAFVFFFAG
jgi:cytochrome P450 family 6